ncbi:hypothetical protein OG455_28140 [Kitasatospora sp. NBC_01287]|uniref:hypothetical protein n=1 Tax=Kitasatospora sp. NBC_01287 TaxID=2903573 RepID=UPI00225342B1|nr:hypothetical protein [Kitasatospora sp. NBC_01287]MCX4749332.1 hypothetical protein [Kitasatospora sp. NBC_01287]
MFIAVTGPDGAGKTTLCDVLGQDGRASGTTPVVVAPLESGKKLALRFGALPAPGPGRWAAREEWMAGYLCLCLVECAERFVLPAMEAGGTVVADKWVADLRVSQDYFGVDLSRWSAALSRLPVPDLTVVLHSSVDTLSRRLAEQGHDGPGARQDYLEHAVRRYARLRGRPGMLHLAADAPTGENAARVREALVALPQQDGPGR